MTTFHLSKSSPGGRVSDSVVIGVAGEIGSGKDTLAEHLVDKYGFLHISLSTVVARGRKRSGLPENRHNQLTYANSKRDLHTGDYFVRLALEEADEVGAPRIVLSGIYCLEEAGHIQDLPDGFVVGVIGPDADTRYDMVVARMANKTDVMGRDQFDQMAHNESAGPDGKTPNVRKVMERADFTLRNQATLQEFFDSIDQMMSEHFPKIAPSARNNFERSGNAPTPLSVYRAKVHELQRRHVASSFIEGVFKRKDLADPVDRVLAQFRQGLHPVHQITNDFMERLLEVLLPTGLTESLNKFRSLEPRTVDEEMVCLINDGQFRELHRSLHLHLGALEDAIVRDVTLLMVEHHECDDAQFANVKKRSLATMRNDGIDMVLDRDFVDVVAAAQREAGKGLVPVTELVKSEKILHVSDFEKSKISLTIHDFIDHLWLYDLLDRKGILKKHFPLFQSVGNPAATDIYRREGEIIASIGFGVRLWASQQVGFVPRRGMSDIANRMYQHFESCTELTPEIMDIHKHVRKLDRNPGCREAQSLGFVFNNYLIELNEQRRKHGEIKRIDVETETIIGDLDPWSHDFMCMFVDVHRELLKSHNKHRDNLLRTHILVEEFLSSEAALELRPINLGLTDLATEIERPSIPHSRIEWMSRHHGFSAVRESSV